MNLFAENEALARSFGAEAQRVPITTDSNATRGAEGMTAFGHVHLAPGRFETDTHEGRVRLGHEVAHAIQQERGAGLSPRLTRSHRESLESEAERAGHAFANGASFSVQGRAPRAAPLFRGPGDEELSAFEIEQNAAWAKLEAKWAIIDERIAADRKRTRDYVKEKAQWYETYIPVDDALRNMHASKQQHELDVRFVMHVLGKSGGTVSREDAEEVLRRIGWQSGSTEDMSTADQIRTRDKIHYRSKAAGIVIDEYNNLTEDRRRAWARGWEKGSTGPHYADAVFADIGRGMYNGGLSFTQGLIDIPMAVPNLVQTIRGKEPIHTFGINLGTYRASYRTDYGLKYGSSIELGTVLGLAVVSGNVGTGAPGAATTATTAITQASRITRLLGYLGTFMKVNAVVGGGTAVIQAGQAINDLRRGYKIVDGKQVPLTEDDVMERLAGIAFGLHAAKTAITSGGNKNKGSGGDANDGALTKVPAPSRTSDMLISRPDAKTIRIQPIGQRIALVLDESGWRIHDENGKVVRSGPADEAALLAREYAGVDLPGTQPATPPAPANVPTVPQLPAPAEPTPVVTPQAPSAPKMLAPPKDVDPPKPIDPPRVKVLPRLPAPTEPDVAPDAPTPKEPTPVAPVAPVEPTTAPQPPTVAAPTTTPSAKRPRKPSTPKIPTTPKADTQPKQRKSNAADAKEEQRSRIQEQLDKTRAEEELAAKEAAGAERAIAKLRNEIAKLEAEIAGATGKEKKRLQKRLERAKFKLNEEKGGGWIAEKQGAAKTRAEKHFKVMGLKALLRLGRPTLRAKTKQTIKDRAREWMKKEKLIHPDDVWVDQATKKVITDKPVLGHVDGKEHWRLALQAQEQRMTQKQFSDWVNEHPEWFRVESEASNRSHANEDHSDFEFTDFD